MVKRIADAIVLACVAAIGSGCATIVNGTTERVQIDSTPPGAEVAIDDSQHLLTPSSVKLSRASAHKLVFHKSGYEDATANLTSSTSGWILGNLLAGGVVGMAIDVSDGAGRKLSSDSVKVSLTPLPSRSSKAALPGAPSAILTRDAPAAVAPEDDRPESMPHGPPLEDFTDDEAGYARPAASSLDGQRR